MAEIASSADGSRVVAARTHGPALGTLRALSWFRSRPRTFQLGCALLAAILLLSFGGPIVLGSDPSEQNLSDYLLAPSPAHPFGTDATGRDLLSRVLHGGRPSLVISTFGMLGSILLGLCVGMLAAFGGRMAQRVTGFVVDVQLALPYVLVAIVLVSVAGASIPLLVLMMVLAGWVQVGRVVRSIALRERSKDYVKAAAVVGASRARIARRYVLPSVLPVIVALAPLQMAAMLVIEATLSFLGMGVRPPQPSWGSIMLEGKNYIDSAWWLTTFPGLAIFLTALSLLLIGDGFERAEGGSLDRVQSIAADDQGENLAPVIAGRVEP